MGPRQAVRAKDPRRGSLSRADLAATAIDLIEQRGIDNLTMRALAAEVGCGTMTLYGHVRSRDDLIIAIVEQLISELDVDASTSSPDDSWQDVLRQLFRSYQELAIRHPRAFELLALAPYDSEPVASHLGAVLAAIERAGLDPQEARTALAIADAFATGFLVVWARSRTASDPPAPRTVTPLGDLRSSAMYEKGIDLVLAGLKQPLRNEA